tara:strand:- start:238 stop:999 length:762 start_codon:yes stop_codon:yes gene_type:complete
MEWMDKIEFLDQQIVLLLNGSNNPYFDQFMWLVTNPIFGIPFYILFIYLIFKNYNFISAYVIIWIIGFTVGLGDLLAHELIKETIQRFRPSHHLEISKHLNFVNEYKGGRFGFVSNHATNMSIVGIMVFLFLKKYYHKCWIYLLIFVVLISYSRIYLGVHYLSDIIGGWILGALLSFTFYKLYCYLRRVFNKHILKNINIKLFRGYGFIGGICQGLANWTVIKSNTWRIIFLFFLPVSLGFYMYLWLGLKKKY